MKVKPFIIGIAGGTASGKTLLASIMFKHLSQYRIAIIKHDNYYKNRSDEPLLNQENINYDHPDALETDLLIKHLEMLSDGQSVVLPIYDFKTHCRSKIGITVESPQIIIVEGILVLAIECLRNVLDFKMFIDVDSDLRFIRRLQRDIKERGRDVQSIVNQYLGTTRVMHQKFIDPSKQYADLLLTSFQKDSVINEVIPVVTDRVETRLNATKL